MDIESDNFHPASAYGYRNGADIQSDNYTPASEYGYRNGMDIQSDNYMPASEYGYKNGSDIQSDAFDPATLKNYRNGSDIASDQTRRRIDAVARSARERQLEGDRESTRFAEMAYASSNGRSVVALPPPVQPQPQAYSGPSMRAWDGKSGVYADSTPHPFYGTFEYGVAKSLPDAAVTIAAPEMLAAKVGPLLAGAVARGERLLGLGASTAESTTARTFAFNAFENPGPLALLPGRPAGNFFGGRYNAMALEEDVILQGNWGQTPITPITDSICSEIGRASKSDWAVATRVQKRSDGGTGLSCEPGPDIPAPSVLTQ